LRLLSKHTFGLLLLMHGSLALAEARGVKVVADDGKVVMNYSDSYALLIGNSDYQNGWEDLPSIPGELDNVERTLIKQGFMVERHQDLTAKELEAAYNDFADKYGYKSSNRLILFYSGHGYSRNDGRKGYLVPVDAPNPEVEEEGFLRRAVSMTQIRALARDMEATHSLFLFDSCFSGSIFKSRSIASRSSYINQMTAKPVRQFITSGSAGETVPANSVFTPAFVDALDYGLGDLNRDGFVTGTELGLYLQETVTQFLPQTPQFGKIDDYELSRGDFIFALNTVEPSQDELPSMSSFLKNLENAKPTAMPSVTPEALLQLQRMQKAHTEILEYELQASPNYSQRLKAWDYFLSKFSDDVPGSPIDNELHEFANKSLANINKSMRLLQEMQANHQKTIDRESQHSVEERISYWRAYIEKYPTNLPDSTVDDELLKLAHSKVDDMMLERQWQNTMGHMDKVFNQIQDDSTLSNAAGKQAWGEFLTEYNADNPSTMKDNLLRDAARKQLQILKKTSTQETVIARMNEEYLKVITLDDQLLTHKISLLESFIEDYSGKNVGNRDAKKLVDTAQSSIIRLRQLTDDEIALATMTTDFDQIEQGQSSEMVWFLARFESDILSSREDEKMRREIEKKLKSLEVAARKEQLAKQQQQEIDNKLRQAIAQNDANKNLTESAPAKYQDTTQYSSRMLSLRVSNIMRPDSIRQNSVVMNMGGRLADLMKTGYAYLGDGDYSNAVQAFTQSIASKPDQKKYQARGVARQLLGDIDGAITDYTASINNYPTSTSLYNRGLSYLEIGETDKALIDLSSVIDKMGLNSAYNNRAIAYASLGQFDLARADLSEALEKNDRYVLALINRGIVLEALGELDNAMADYDLALELDHMNPDANRNSRLLWKRIKAKQ